MAAATGAGLMPRLSLAQDAPPAATQPVVSNAVLYAQAEADFKAGQFEKARGEFQTLAGANFKAPVFHESPSDYLKDIDSKGGGPGRPAEGRRGACRLYKGPRRIR
jgi:hypothetical protein